MNKSARDSRTHYYNNFVRARILQIAPSDPRAATNLRAHTQYESQFYIYLRRKKTEKNTHKAVQLKIVPKDRNAIEKKRE